MHNLVKNFPNQLSEALKIGNSFTFRLKTQTFKNVVLTGLGGSGIGGSIVQDYVYDLIKIPFWINKGYTLPAFVNKNSLVIVCSYSGNTEETVQAMQIALKANAKIVCITSGGIIEKWAEKNNIDCIKIPSGNPPRASLGYSLSQILFTLAHFKLINNNFKSELKSAINLLVSEEKNIIKIAQKIASNILGKTPIIYAGHGFEGIAIRFRQQLNENSKILALHHVIPEMNHNELVGWADKQDDKVVIMFRSDSDLDRIKSRMDINKKIIKKYTPNYFEIKTKGENYWEQAFYLVHLTDWVSVFLADLRKKDAVEVKVIDYLKSELAKL